MIAGAANGVNLTDGLDGLAAGTVTISLFTYTAIGVVAWIVSQRAPIDQHSADLDLAILGASLIGASIGFLWYNAFPGPGLHGRHRLDGARWSARRVRDHDEDRDPADPDRRDLPDRGALGDPPGRQLQALLAGESS